MTMPDTLSPQRLIFLHIPKTGGRALRFVIARQFSTSVTYELYAMRATQHFQNLSQEERDRYLFFTGHTFYGIHHLLSGSSSYITLLRDPVQHLLSRYYFAFTDTRHRRHNNRKTLTLDSFISQEQDKSPQTRRIVGMSQQPNGGDATSSQPVFLSPREPLPAEALQIAQQHLVNHFSVVGLTEAFDLSLLLMKRVLGWSNVHYIQRNINRKRPRDISPDVLRRIENITELDLALYTFAETLFQKQIEQFAPDIHQELVRFRRANRVYARLRTPLTMVRSMLVGNRDENDD